MGFPNDWGRKCELKIQASKVAENLTNYPVFLTEANLPSEMFDSDGSYPALSGGGDIRFSSDAAGLNRLPCEIVRFVIDPDPANGIAEIHVNVASVSSSVDTSVWIWYDKAGENQPGVTEPYGRNATWNSSYKCVWHLDNHEGTRPDSTGNSDIDSGSGMPDQITGKVGRASLFDASGAYFTVTDPADPGIGVNEAFCVSTWLYCITPGRYDVFFSVNHSVPDFNIYPGATYEHPSMYWTGTGYIQPSAPDRNIDDGAWHLLTFTRTGDTITFYVDGGNSQGTATHGAAIPTPDEYWMGGDWDVSRWYGGLDEMRVCDVARSANFIISEYNNQDDPATFVIEQTPSGPGGSLFKLEGITKDKNGDVLGSCECYVFKDLGNNTLVYKGYALSDPSTGAYSVTGLSDDDANYIVVGWKDDTPHVLDVSDHVLQPVAQ